MQLSYRTSVQRGLLSLLLIGIAQATPIRLLALNTTQDREPALIRDFPDPSILQDDDGTWYAFATASHGKHIQIATAQTASGPWTYIDEDLLPDTGPWTSGENTWAPDVRRIGNGTYVMYYSGELANNTAHHCVGVATASSVRGPWTAKKQPLVCNLAQGGAIDPSGYLDSDGKRYIVYKVDGNSIGHGGSCGNTVSPIVSTPIMLLELEADGVTPAGDPVQILDRTSADGPLIEAPNLIKTSDGSYVLFFSSNCYTTPEYDVSYAISGSITGPYKRASTALFVTGDYNLTSPGGATSIDGGGSMVFHANCDAGRCMYVADYTVTGTDVIVNGLRRSVGVLVRMHRGIDTGG